MSAQRSAVMIFVTYRPYIVL